MKTINRSAMVVVPKQPFVDWLNGIPDPNFKPDGKPYTLEQFGAGETIYLVPNFDYEDDMIAFFDDFKEDVFDEELGAWYTDENTWPKKRNPKVFDEWFDSRLIEMVFDLADEDPLVREED